MLNDALTSRLEKAGKIDPSTFRLVDDRTSPIHVFYLNITPAVKLVCFIHAMIMIFLTALIQNMMGLCVLLLSIHAFKIVFNKVSEHLYVGIFITIINS